MRGATSSKLSQSKRFGFNSRPSCEGRHAVAGVLLLAHVSIHAPHARGDAHRGEQKQDSSFNSRPSCEGRHIQTAAAVHPGFQFTPLMRGATVDCQFKTSERVFQFTPLMRGATSTSTRATRISSFNSRPSCEGRLVKDDDDSFHLVSIHAPHARGDYLACHTYPPFGFNSRPSCEGRLDRCRFSKIK